MKVGNFLRSSSEWFDSSVSWFSLFKTILWCSVSEAWHIHKFVQHIDTMFRNRNKQILVIQQESGFILWNSAWAFFWRLFFPPLSFQLILWSINTKEMINLSYISEVLIFLVSTVHTKFQVFKMFTAIIYKYWAFLNFNTPFFSRSPLELNHVIGL